MKTRIAGGTIFTDGYDVVAELEAQGDPHGTAKWIREKKEEYAQQARTYLSNHPKSNYYTMYGYSTIVETDSDVFSRPVAYTDAEVQRIKELFVGLWNQSPTDPDIHANTYDEIPQEELTFTEFGEKNAELDALVWQRGNDSDFNANRLDLQSSLHAYQFSTWEYDPEKKEMGFWSRYRVVLTDEEYLYLLTEQLFDDYFSFNRLILTNPSLAQRICATTDGDGTIMRNRPYLILLDEVQADAKEIRKTIESATEKRHHESLLLPFHPISAQN